MSNTHAPIETMTKGQIVRVFDRFEAKCLKGSLPKEPTQHVLEQEGDAIVQEMFEALRRRVERRSEIIVRHFKVDRTKSPLYLLDATRRVQYVNKDVLATMPTDGPEEGDLVFFPTKRFLPVREVAAEFESRGLVPDPIAQFQVNIDDPTFADGHPNGTQWGTNSYLTFDRWNGERGVLVDRSVNGWHGSWWLAGRRKQS